MGQISEFAASLLMVRQAASSGDDVIIGKRDFKNLISRKGAKTRRKTKSKSELSFWF